MSNRAPRRASEPLPPVAEATRAATIGLGAVAAGLVVAYAAWPRQRAWLAAGNGLVDAATALALLAALIIALWAIHRTPGAARWCRLLPVAALLGLLDEVHLAAGLLHFSLPTLGPVTIDGFSALVAAGQHVATTQLGLSPVDLAAASAVVIAAAAFMLARRRRATRAAAWLADHTPALHLLAAAALAAAAVALDVLAATQLADFAEEWLEFAAAALLLRGALLIPRHNPAAAGWRQRLRPWLDGETPQRAMPSAGSRRPG
jgi:hypothetical protein